MAGLKSIMVVLVIIMAASFQLQFTVGKTRHVVGDALGWTIPPGGEATYATWASGKNFIEGDTLIFNFLTGLHSVAEVPHAAYGPCNFTNTLSINPTGPATITLNRPGKHYYICTILGHCQIGQKLSINVAPSTNTAPKSRPPSPPTSAIATSPYPFEKSPVGSPIRPPLSAAPSFTTVVPVTILATALAFLY